MNVSKFHSLYEKHLTTEDSWPSRLSNRIHFWPILNLEGNRFVAVENSFSIPGLADPSRSPNFWTLSKQYYALAWTLFTLAYSETYDLPYKSNISSEDDVSHRQDLQEIIHNHGFGHEAMLDIAHLSCETALKAILVHTLPDLGQPSGFPKDHDLERLISDLGKQNIETLETMFSNWPERPANLSLEKIIQDSGD